MPYSFLADLVLVTHVLIVLFIVGGLILILLGAALHWEWVRNIRFRGTHLAAIAVVVLQAWLEVYCPLTSLEMYFRGKAGQATHSKSFVAYWLHELLYYEAPFWVFTVVYTLFGLAVFLAWKLVPPRQLRKKKNGAE